MSGDADKELMEAVLRQIDGKIDYQQLASDLRMSTAKVAYQRWSRFKKAKLGQKKSSTGVRATQRPAATPPKTPKSTVKGKQRKGSKKRKIAASDDEDEEIEIKEGDDAAGEGMWDGAVPETPSRRLPARKARVMSFKEESSDVEDEEGFEDSGHGSGHGGTEEEEELGDFDEEEV